MYDESNIVSLGLIGGIRKRPTMYIKATGPRGVVKLAHEVLQNAVDEANAGRCSHIIVKIDTKNSIITIKDNGAGIPIGKIHAVMNEMHTGGKFDNKGYEFHIGQNGVGLMVTNCLSDFLLVKVWRDGKFADCRYERGQTIYEKIIDYTGDEQGTSVEFKPDASVLGDISIDIEMLENIVEVTSSCSPGLMIDFIVDKKKKTYVFTETFDIYLQSLISKQKHHKIFPIIYIEDKSSMKMQLITAFTFCSDLDKENVLSYVNNFPTEDGGTHVTGCRAAISRVLTYYIKKHNCIPKSFKFQVTGADLIDNLYIIIVAKHYDPQFDGQTKGRLSSADYETYCSSVVYEKFLAWCENNTTEMDKIIKYAIKKAKAREAARNAKEQAMAPNTTKNLLSSKIDLKKFTDCKSNDPMKNELFLLEGDSAGGTASQARDDNFQAFLRLRGKVLNVAKKDGKLSPEQEAIIEAMGMGFGNKKDYSKLKYHKIIIMTDADPDGCHIRSLLLTFYLTYYPELIQNGHIYVAAPPFYQLVFNKNKKLNILNDQYFKYYKEIIALETFDLLDSEENKLSRSVFKEYLKKLIGFTDFMNQFKDLNMDLELLELIVRNFDSLMTGNYKQFEFFGFTVKSKKISNKEKTFQFNREYENYYVRINPDFFENVYKPIYYRMCEFMLSNVKLRGKKSGFIYGGTSYYLCNIIDSTMKGKNFELKRFKGLGEMDADVLRETAMDPITRRLIKVTVDNAKDADYWTNVLMGSKDMNVKKQMFLN